jgi:hypothetical protein
MDIYKSKELWRGPESIYTLKHGLCIAHDIYGPHSADLLAPLQIITLIDAEIIYPKGLD